MCRLTNTYNLEPTRWRVYNRHGVFDTNRLRLIIYTDIASQLKRLFDPTTFGISPPGAEHIVK